MSFDSRCVCVSGSVFGSFHCSWIIPKFSSLNFTVNRDIESEYFQLQPYSPRWRVIIYPGGETDDDEKGSITCYLNYSSRDTEEILVNIHSISLLNIDGEVLSRTRSSMDSYSVVKNNEATGFSTAIRRDRLIKKLIDDVLILCMSVSYCNTCVKDSENTQYLAEMSPISKLVGSFRSLMNRESADINILVGKREIPVHSVILSARSKVFQAMFQNDMKEKKSHSVEITDFDKSTMDALIQFIYTGNNNFMNVNVALELLRASDKYDMYDLMAYCSNYLISMLNEENVIPVLLKADMCNARALKTKAMRYLSRCRVREIIKKHRSVLKNHPDVLLDILEANGSEET